MKFKGTEVVESNYNDGLDFYLQNDKGAIGYYPAKDKDSFPVITWEKKDANLIADAFNTANECGMMPSELLARNKELLEVVQKCHAMAASHIMPTEKDLEMLYIKSKKVLKR